ncbi:MAG: D-alanyl-D-alanine carboxypeptidase, partial [Alphaproteobacteria bacterium]|nr:D-alanyl-D-alanine carboxypeptidase [Alphaproteobacteria bacterium]
MKKFLALLSIVAVFNADCAKQRKKVRLSNALSKRTAVQSTRQKPGLSDAKQAVLIDFDTGETLYDKSSREKCTPSSMTKLMTSYILFSALKDGRLKMDDELLVSEEAQRMEGSRSFFKAGTYAKVEDLIRSIIVHSGNDACVIVAEALSGDPTIFADEMNRKAEEFGLTDTHFTNPAGMPDEEHYSTAHDLAIIAQRLIKDFPEYYSYFSEKVFTVNGITQPNRNTLLGNSMGVDGLKTGHTNAGGYGLVSSAARNGKRLIAVVNGCSSMKSRSLASNSLLTLGYREFVNFRAIKAGTPVVKLKVWLGDKNEIELCTHEDINIMVPRKFQNELKMEAKMKEPIEAPIALGAKVGEL